MKQYRGKDGIVMRESETRDSLAFEDVVGYLRMDRSQEYRKSKFMYNEGYLRK